MGPLLVKLVLTKAGETTQTYSHASTNRLLNVAHSEEPYSQLAEVVVDNRDSNLTSLDLRGYKGVLSYGYNDATNGDEFSATAPLWVIAQRLDSYQGGLVASFTLIGTADLMDRDHASEAHTPDFTDARTVKEILREVAKGGWAIWVANTAYALGDFIIPTTSNGLVYKCTTAGTSGGTEPATWATTEGNTTSDNTATWTCRGVEIKSYRHTTAYTITFDSEDSLIDVFQPKDSFRILVNDTRLGVIKKLVGFTKCVFRVEDDEELHILTPTTTGTTYNYEYKLDTSGEHTFFNKSHRKRLVIPNYIVAKSHPDDVNQYTGFDEDTDSSGLLAKREYHYLRLASNAQATTMATAILARYQLNAEGGSGLVPMNVGQEVFDYIKFTDSRDADDTRVGNIGYLRRKYRPGKFEMELRFGSSFRGLGDIALPSISREGGIVRSSSGATGDEAIWEVMEKTWGFLERVADNYDALKAQVAGEIEGIKTRKEDAFAWMLPVSSQAFTASIAFTVTDDDDISWAAGNVQLADGRTQAVDSGSLVLTGTHYLYVIWGNRVIQNTTTYSTAVGSDKVLIGISKKASTAAQKAYILIPHTDNVLINIDKLGQASELFGDGDDGDVTIASDTTLARDMVYNDLTVNSGKVLTTAGYRIFVKGTLTNNGTIRRNGNAGGNASDGVAGTGGAALAAGSLGASGAGADGRAPAASPSSGGGASGGGVVLIVARTLTNNGTISANGGNGGNAFGTGSNLDAAGLSGSSVTASLGGSGGAGGSSSPGSAGTATTPTAAQGGFRAPPMAILLKDETTKITGGAGGGGGGVASADTGGGGGGGGGGGLVVLIYNLFTASVEQASGGSAGASTGNAPAASAGSAGSVLKLAFV